ncbi:MAG: penicillin-binding protein activator [Rickettsiales bacterium]|jgi:outer membrane PBP1 activator LpoA protein|nr:penicillin-binding protein activator [Rickettsiales bacterium]
MIKNIKKLFGHLVVWSFGLLVAGCVNSTTTPAVRIAGQPVELVSDFYTEPNAVAAPMSSDKSVGVILPMSGENAGVGNSIKSAIEIAFVQKNAGVSAKFYDIADMSEMLVAEHDFVLGPVFANNAAAVRDAKSARVPAISFSSNAASLGRGMYSVALMPGQSVDAIVSFMPSDGRTSVMIFAPNNDSGFVMANAAVRAVSAAGLRAAGLYYYTPADMDSIKAAAQTATSYDARVAANTRAREVLSDAILKGRVAGAERNRAVAQLEKLNKADTIGDVGFDAALFLGGPADSKSIASFLRYFDAPTRRVKFYGTAQWDDAAMYSEMSFAGAAYSAMPATAAGFAGIYEQAAGVAPTRLASMGYDAAGIAIDALSRADASVWLENPSGWRGLDGVLRFNADGTATRALAVWILDGSGVPKLAMPAVPDFVHSAPAHTAADNTRPRAFDNQDPVLLRDLIRLPANVLGRYDLRNPKTENREPKSGIDEVQILPESDTETIPGDAGFTPVVHDAVEKKLVDEVTLRR